jgi:hypothetical protein
MDFLKLWYTSDEQKELFERKFNLLESGNKDVLKDLCYCIEVLPEKYKIEALLKLTPRIIDLGEWEEADYDIQKLKEIASQSKDKDLKAIEIFDRVLELNLIEIFIDLCWDLIFKEFKAANLGNGKKFIRTAFDLETRLEKEEFEAPMMNFFKTAVDSGGYEVLKTVIDEIIEIKDGNCPELLKPLCKAVEIVETKDIKNYYKLQVEEREIVAEIVLKLSKSEDLLHPEYIKR